MPGKDHKSGSRLRASSRFDAGSRAALLQGGPGLVLTDLLLAGLLLVLPFVMGGREALGHKLLISAALALAAAWCLHQFWNGGRLVLSRLEPLLVAGLLLVWFQTVPQPAETLQRVSPEYQRLLPDWGLTQTGVRPVAAGKSPAEQLPATEPAVGATATPAAGAASAGATSGTATWQTISLIPVETQHALLVLAAYSLIGLVVGQRIQSEVDGGRILKLVAVSGVLMAVFAVVQLATTNDRFFWFYRHPYTGTSDILKGAFTNRNHFAQFLVLSLGPLTWWMLHERRTHADQAPHTIRQGLGPAQGNHSQFGNLINVRLLLLMSAAAGVLLCVLMSLSRGGMVAAGTACVVVLAGLWRLAAIRASLAVVVMGLGIAVIGGLLLMGGDKVEARVEQLASADADRIDQANGRRTIWKADLQAVRAFPLLGTGVGSHRDVYPIYMTELADFASHEFTHAESTYLHLALETGLVGLGLLVCGLLLVLGRLLLAVLRRAESPRGEYVAAVLASLTAGAVHATADFVWYVPAIVVTTVVLAATGLRLAGGTQHLLSLPVPRIGWLAAGAGCVAALLAVQPELTRRWQGERHFYQYLIATFDEQQQIGSAEEEEETEADAVAAAALSDDPSTTDAAAAADGGDYRQEDPPDEQKELLASAQRRLQMLMRSLKANPRQPRVQLRLATLSLNLFEQLQQQSDNPLTLAQISDVVATSQFSSAADMQRWLQRAFGKSIRLPFLADQMARQSLQGCPILGGSYLVLAETSFLRDPGLAGQTQFVNQALLLRGHDPRTRFFAGERALLAGDQEEALRQWAAVFHSNRDFRRKITRILARMTPAAFLIERFQPNTVELRDVMETYVALERQRDLPAIIQAIEQTVVAEADTATVDDRVGALMQASDAAYRLQQRDHAEALARQAIACDETAYWPRRSLGLLLYEAERFAEAGQVLMWCYEQRPGDERLDRLIRDARRRAVTQTVPVVPVGYQP